MTHREQHTAAERPGGQPVEPDPRAMDRDALRAYLRTTHTVSLWPFAGRALGNLSRPATYRAAANGGIRTLSLGCRKRVVPSVWIATALLLEDARVGS